MEDLQVTVSGEPDPANQVLRLALQDNGPGMNVETVERAFEPYYTTKEHGTGLGLAIVKKILLEHRGAIEVQSEPGEGTRFTLTLPLNPDPPKT